MKILITDDHAVIRRGLKQILLEEFPSAAIEEATDAETAIKKSLSENYDVIISDLSMPGRSGLDLLSHIRQHSSRTPVLILSMHPEEQYAIRALKAGAAGYLSKESAPEELVKAVNRVLQGRKYISTSIADKLFDELDQPNNDKPAHEQLSHREFDVFKLIAGGKSVSEISEQLTLSISTVSTYRARILTKMRMKSNAELTRYALEYKLI
ncbi:response regulator transcription factor [Pollutibacter soli]|uniref:response regulator transcription factor n=1 Tax=Pollutibacter soli TaxID=3034157 RepID=UPI00301355B4